MNEHVDGTVFHYLEAGSTPASSTKEALITLKSSQGFCFFISNAIHQY